MITPSAEDPTTQAQIYVEEARWPGQSSDITVFTRLVDSVAFSYSSDILQLGDPFTVMIPNPRGEHTHRFARGSRIHLYLKSPAVNGGTPALKHTGIVVKRSASCSLSQGSVIQLDCADLGWHLEHNDAPLWYKLQYGRFIDLLQDRRFIDPSWGIAGISTDNEIGRLIRRGKNNGRSGATVELSPHVYTPLYLLQVEPGDRVADILITYARRINVLVNVSADGYLQLFRPNYNQKPLHHIELHGLEEIALRSNNVLDARVEETIENIYTEVTVLGEIVGSELTQIDPTNQNAAKRRGSFVDNDVLPFVHRKNQADGDLFDRDSAKKQAKWLYERSLFESWTATYVVRGHHQGGEWWEADTMCEVHDTIHDVKGTFYVQAVRCDRDERSGDRTTVTLRKPGLLQAAYGVYARAGIAAVTPPATSPGTETETKNVRNWVEVQ